jgi:hypothetical protein
VIHKAVIYESPEDLKYEREVLNPWQRLRIGIWRSRTNRAFDARDQHPVGSWQWAKANERVEKRFS